MESLWQKNSPLPAFPPLTGDAQTEVLVIGGGMAGLLCAWQLRQSGVPCLLVEADRLCGGVTGKTTAKITAQHGLLYHKLLRRFGEGMAKGYLQANLEALARYREMSRDIDCDFAEKDNFVYSTNSATKLRKELAALEAIGFPGELVEDLPLPFPTAGAIRFPNQAQFDPIKFAAGIVPGLNIYEHTPIRGFDGSCYWTDWGRIQAKKTIIATHFPFLNKHGLYFLKLYQHRSYVLALEGGPDVDGMYVDEESTGYSLRNAGPYLLLGGGAHRTGKTGGGWAELEAFARKHYSGASIRFRWATQDCMNLDGIPYIGPYSPRTPETYVATGFQKWGMTSSMAAATILCDLVQGKPNLYEDIFSPQRSLLRPQLLSNGFHAVANLLTPTVPRCPHMGCALKWNPQEHSWDCPCHGSRFTEAGKLISGPATGGLKKRPKDRR